MEKFWSFMLSSARLRASLGALRAGSWQGEAQISCLQHLCQHISTGWCFTLCEGGKAEVVQPSEYPSYHLCLTLLLARPQNRSSVWKHLSWLLENQWRRNRCVRPRNACTFLLLGELIIWTIYIGLCWIHCHMRSFNQNWMLFLKIRSSLLRWCLVKDFLGEILSHAGWRNQWPF